MSAPKIPNTQASVSVHPLVNRCPHFGQDFALFATSLPHLHFRTGPPFDRTQCVRIVRPQRYFCAIMSNS